MVTGSFQIDIKIKHFLLWILFGFYKIPYQAVFNHPTSNQLGEYFFPLDVLRIFRLASTLFNLN